ncbi:MAG: sigma-E processing peptidase SpoIIGA, partial [Ruminiclostridium sp.]
MTIYLDVLIIVNIYITYFILKAAARLLHIKYRFFRLAAGSVFGGFSSLAAVLSLD